MLYALVCILLRITARLFFRVRISGLENIPPKEGIIVAANHLSYLDITLIGYTIYMTGRQADFMAKKELLSIPVVGSILRILRGFPIDRDKLDRKALREAVRRLRADHIIVLFPEGTRSRDGKLQPGKPGIGLIVRMSGKKVIPVAIQGTDKAMPVGSWFVRPAPITIQYGRPLDFSGHTNGDDETRGIEQTTKVIMDNIAALMNTPLQPA